MVRILITLISALIPFVLQSQILRNKEDKIEIYSCYTPLVCFDLANKYLNQLELRAGQVFSTKRFASENQANIAAAKLFGPAAFDSFREPHWIVFKDKNYINDAYGFTYPAVSKSLQRKSTTSQIVFNQFTLNKDKNLSARSLGHVHFDNNEFFSFTDLKNFIGKSGKFVLLTRSGNLSYITDQLLRDEYHIKRTKDIRNHTKEMYKQKTKSEKAFFYKNRETGISGVFIENIFIQNLFRSNFIIYH